MSLTMNEKGGTIEGLKVGDIVMVNDLSSYKDPPVLPREAPVARIDEYPYIVVEIDGVNWEVYTFGFTNIETMAKSVSYCTIHKRNYSGTWCPDCWDDLTEEEKKKMNAWIKGDAKDEEEEEEEGE
jgi:hypothetical protein